MQEVGYVSVNPSSCLRFVDLFAGLGGFHVALGGLGHRCVFAAEVDPDLNALYERNFGLRPGADIRFCWKDIPQHDILCAGFPCQPFSKAGNQKGFECPDSGDLFDYILKVVDRHRPPFLIFENVPNILRHADGETWARIRTSLSRRGYTVDHTEISPHQIGVPQVRTRAIIVAALSGLDHFSWPKTDFPAKNLSIHSVLEPQPDGGDRLSDQYIEYLDVWEDFLVRTSSVPKLPSFPIWSMEFGANYPLERPPAAYHHRYRSRFRGSFGCPLKGLVPDSQLAQLPAYVRSSREPLPRWKVRYIEQNREFYEEHKSKLRGWLPKIRDFPASFQKFEWNWQDGTRTIWDKVVQFRASGIRVKNPATSPSLVALTTSQVPVIAAERRYMAIQECARLQSLDSLSELPSTKTAAFKALGNAVNSKVISQVAENLIQPIVQSEKPATDDRHQSVAGQGA